MDFSLSPFEPVADGVLVAVAEPASVNIGLVVGATGALVVDTGSSPAQGFDIRAAAERAAGVPLVGAVATHAHYDHLYGLAAFADLTTWGHASLPDAVAAVEDLDDRLHELGFQRDDLGFPSRPFSLAATVDLGGRFVELVHFGPGHTAGDVVAIVPDADVIFAGDLLEESGPPSFGPDSDPQGWPRALDGILGVLRAGTVIVPGHGRPFDRDFAFNQRGEIAGTWAQIEWLARQGVGLPDAYERGGEWNFPRPTIEELLPLAYERLAARGVRPSRNLPVV